MKRVAVIGASGFVGSTLVERLLVTPLIEVVPFIHTSGNAWRLARFGLNLRVLDLLDRKQVIRDLDGVTHIVNCSRGSTDVMLRGLENLLAASKRVKVERFVHLGSVAVYGDPPHPESENELAPTEPRKDSYGWVKLRQDQMVGDMAAKGLSATVLCPPNISGAYSPYVSGLVDALRKQEFAILEDGSATCNLVDVRNLVHAVELALDNGPIDGTRLFITDDEPTTWRDVVDSLIPLFESTRDVRAIGRNELVSAVAPNTHIRHSLLRSVKHLASSDVRQALRRDPFWGKLDRTVRSSVTRLGKTAESALRISVEGPIRIEKVTAGPRLNIQLSAQQLRGIRHSCQLAKTRLGYRPVYSFDESMEAFRSWYRSHHGMDSPFWPLLRQLG